MPKKQTPKRKKFVGKKNDGQITLAKKKPRQGQMERGVKHEGRGEQKE